MHRSLLRDKIGVLRIEGQPDETLARGDILAVPLWHGHALHGIEDATLLRVTDEPIMTKFGLLRRA
jgi:gentisate 1,2-dioxygenase